MFGNKTRLLLVVMCAALASSACKGQEEPIKGELFGGYQYTRIGGSGGTNANGWNAALTGNVNRWFGVTGDFSGAYKSIGGDSAKACGASGARSVALLFPTLTRCAKLLRTYGAGTGHRRQNRD
jgi:hypothetical protein